MSMIDASTNPPSPLTFRFGAPRLSRSNLVTVPRIKARRVLHSAAYSGDDTLLQRIFSARLNHPGSHKRGRTLGLLSAHLLLRCFPRLFIARRVQLSLPSSTAVDSG